MRADEQSCSEHGCGEGARVGQLIERHRVIANHRGEVVRERPCMCERSTDVGIRVTKEGALRLVTEDAGGGAVYKRCTQEVRPLLAHRQ
jgi:hypothetical protein